MMSELKRNSAGNLIDSYGVTVEKCSLVPSTMIGVQQSVMPFGTATLKGWEALREIKEKRATKIRRVGNIGTVIYAEDSSRIIKWYPIEVGYTPQNQATEILRDLLVFDDWEIVE